jgi:hypothetical protein
MKVSSLLITLAQLLVLSVDCSLLANPLANRYMRILSRHFSDVEVIPSTRLDVEGSTSFHIGLMDAMMESAELHATDLYNAPFWLGDDLNPNARRLPYIALMPTEISLKDAEIALGHGSPILHQQLHVLDEWVLRPVRMAKRIGLRKNLPIIHGGAIARMKDTPVGEWHAMPYNTMMLLQERVIPAPDMYRRLDLAFIAVSEGDPSPADLNIIKLAKSNHRRVMMQRENIANTLGRASPNVSLDPTSVVWSHDPRITDTRYGYMIRGSSIDLAITGIWPDQKLNHIFEDFATPFINHAVHDMRFP